MSFYNIKAVYLLLTIPLLIMVFLWGKNIKFKNRKAFIHTSQLEKLAPHYSPVREVIKKSLIIVAIAGLVFSIMRPQYGKKDRAIQPMGIDVLIAVDTSLSMSTEDVGSSRFERATQEIKALLNSLTSDRIGIITFEGNAKVQCPLTTDYDAVKLFVEDLYIGMMDTPGSILGHVISLVKKMPRTKKEKKVLIIYTDGEFFDKRLNESLQIAKSNNINIFTVGIGSQQGDPIPIKDDQGNITQYKQNDKSEIVISKLNEKQLITIAHKTGGKSFLSNNKTMATTQLYKAISQYEKKQFKEILTTNKKDQFQSILIFVWIILLIEFLYPRKNIKIFRKRLHKRGLS